MKIARTITLWITGVLASMIIGGAIGILIVPFGGDGYFGGWVAGACTFTCLRLWLTEGRS